jgi:hypothetical protein
MLNELIKLILKLFSKNKATVPNNPLLTNPLL